MSKCSRCYRTVPSVEWVENQTYCDFRNPYLSRNELSCADRMKRAQVKPLFLMKSSAGGRADFTTK